MGGGASRTGKESKSSYKQTSLAAGSVSYEVTDILSVPFHVDGYPSPAPPKWKKRDLEDFQKMKTIDNNACEIKVNSKTTFEELASMLTKGLVTDLEKIRSVFMWLGYLDYIGQSYPSLTDAETPMGYMKAMKDIGGAGYPRFLTTLCRAANIPCVIIKGRGKGIGYETGDQASSLANSQSTWNAVYVDGSWQVIHPRWAFTAVSGHDPGKWTKMEPDGQETRERTKARQGFLVRHINRDYFLPHPEEFAYRCIPNNQEWQLVDEPWDIDTFCNVPGLELSYFLSDYTLVSAHKAILLSTEGKCEVEFLEHEKPQGNLAFELLFDEEQSKEYLPNDVELPRCVFFETNENRIRLIVRFHVIGIYKLNFMVTMNGKIIQIAAFRLEADEKSRNKNLFPANPAIGFGYGHTAKNRGIDAPSHKSGVVIMKPREVKTIRFTTLTKTKIITTLRHHSTGPETLAKYVIQKVKDNAVTVQVRLPDNGEYALQIYKGKDDDANNVLNYLLSSRKHDFRTSIEIKDKKDIRRRLAVALVKGSSRQLQTSIRQFEEAALKDVDGTLRKSKYKLKKMKEEQQRKDDIKRLKGKLSSAMKSRSIDDLEDAIAEAEMSCYPELDDMTKTAREKIEGIEQREIDTREEHDARDDLIRATQVREVKGLEDAIGVFQKMTLLDKDDLTSAMTTLCGLYEDVAEEAMANDDLDKLEKVLDETEKSVAQADLQEVMKRAYKYLQQQKRIQGFISPVLAMKSSTVAEIQGYSNTSQVTQDVMKATLIVLGEKPKELEGWGNIQKKLNPSGRILKVIKAFKVEHLHEHTTKRAQCLLDKYTADDVRDVSAGVATFYQWTNHMIEEAEQQGENRAFSRFQTNHSIEEAEQQDASTPSSGCETGRLS